MSERETLSGDESPWLPNDVVRGEVGEQEMKELEGLRKWLYGRDPDFDPNYRMVFRVAPSIIARSECELLGVSFPRFAFRAYLTPDCRDSFVNARRIQCLAGATSEWSQRQQAAGRVTDLVTPDAEYAARVSVADVIRRGSTCVADSLIVPPKRFSERFRLLKVALAKAYGEAIGEEASALATPFVKHMRFGGGMCAQAACFIATVLLHQETKGVFGVPEITALSQDPQASELVLGGMTPFDMVRYFRHPSVGLWSAYQTTSGFPRGLLPSSCGARVQGEIPEVYLSHLLAETLSAYSKSGMPLLVPTDLGRMNGVGMPREESIYGAEQLAFDPKSPTWGEHSRRHCVVVVGCHKRHGQLFVIHDPAKMPFMLATSLQLIRARPYRTRRNGEAEVRRRLVRGAFAIPVTPGRVRLPLLNSLEGPEERLSFGLMAIAGRVREQAGRVPQWPGKGPGRAFGEFRLARVGGPAGLQALENGDLSVVPEELTSHFVGLLEDERWCWIERLQTCREGRSREWVWLWDATLPGAMGNDSVQPEDLLQQYLVAVFTRGAGGWSRVFCREHTPSAQDRVAEAGGQQSRSDGIRMSIISSFTTNPAFVARSRWPASPSRTLACELYAFMQPEVDRWIKKWKWKTSQAIQGTITALKFMSELADREKDIDEIARSTSQTFDATVPIVALATFLPEIAWACETTEAQDARRAIRFLGRFARRLQSYGHPTETIELVSGSLVCGIWPGLPRDTEMAKQMVAEEKRMFVANRAADELARSRLLANLDQALLELSSGDDAAPPRIRWSVELEPGPLFVVRDWPTLREFCKDLASKRCSPCVGLNLDIAHWRLASRQAPKPEDEITPEKVAADPLVFRRVAHAHVAGHHPSGHFGDIPLEALNDPERDFGPWIRLLVSRAGLSDQESGELKFSGYLSIELEATKHSDLLTRSVETLARLLGHVSPKGVA